MNYNNAKIEKNNIEYNDPSLCHYYAELYQLDCFEEVNLICKSNDAGLLNIPINSTLIIIVGTNSPEIDLSKLIIPFAIAIFPLDPYFEDNHQLMQSKISSKINSMNKKTGKLNDLLSTKESDYQEGPIGKITLKGFKSNTNTVLELYFLSITIAEQNLTIHKLVITSCEIIESGFYFKSEFIDTDEYFQQHLPEKGLPIAKYFDCGFFDYLMNNSLIVNFTEDRWNVIINGLRDDKIESFYISTPYSIAERIYLEANADNITFHVDDPSKAKLKSVEFITYQPKCTFFSSGNWSEPLEKPLNVYLSRNENVTFDFSDSFYHEWFNFDIFANPNETPTSDESIISNFQSDISDPDDFNTSSTSENIDDYGSQSNSFDSEVGNDDNSESTKTSDNNDAEHDSQSDSSIYNDNDSKSDDNGSSETSLFSNDDNPQSSNTEILSSPVDDIPDPEKPTVAIPQSSVYLIISDEDTYCSEFKKIVEFCQKNPNVEDCSSYSDIKNTICSNGQNINNEISNINDEIDLLIIQTMKDISDLDLGQIKNKISVSIFSIPPDYNDNEGEEYSKILNRNVRRIKDYNKRIKENKASFINIGLRGNIQNKVSFLTLQSLSLEIRNEPINIENLRFLDSVINSKSQMIQVIHFIVSEVSHESIIKNSQSKIKVSQYSIEESYDYDSSNYRISFEQNQWNILRGNDNNYSPFFEDAPSYVPYNLCDRLTLIMKSHLFDLHVDNNQITVAKPVNITLLSFEDLDNSHLLEDKNYAVQITTSGNWDGIKEATSIYFTAHQNQVTLDTRECNSKVKIEKYDFSNLPVELPPISIEDETKKENVGIGEVKIDSNKPEEIKKNIEELFKEKNTTSNKQVDHVITIESDPNQEIVFENLHLESNQYLKVDNNANIKLASGQLNLVLDEHSSQVNINVEKSNDVKLAFKNMDKCLVKIDTGSEEKKNITISSKSEVYGPLQIEAGKNVEHIEIDSINLHKSGSLSSTVPITVNNIAAQPQTSGKLTKVVV